MSVRRAALAVWILFQLAVIGVYFELRSVDLRYELAEHGRKLTQAGRNRSLARAELEAARRPPSPLTRLRRDDVRPR